jgi:hypothetical protein
MSNLRTELQREVAEALIASKAINFDAVGNLISKYGARAARTGDAIGAIIHWRVIDICIPPDPYQIVNFAAIRGAETAKG